MANVLHADTRTTLPLLPSRSYALVLSSPPYNVQKRYEQSLTHDQYAQEQAAVVEHVCRVVCARGAVCWQVGWTMHGPDAPYPLEWLYDALFARHGFAVQRRLYWTRGHGLNATRRFSGRHESITIYAREALVDDTTVVQRWSREFPPHAVAMLEREWHSGVLVDVPNVKANHVEYCDHPAQFPVELAERFIVALTERSQWVLDPYCGVGTTLCAAALHHRLAVGIEWDAQYAALARERVARAQCRTLTIRQVGTPLYDPGSGEQNADSARKSESAALSRCGHAHCSRLLLVRSDAEAETLDALVQQRSCACLESIVVVDEREAPRMMEACRQMVHVGRLVLRNRIICTDEQHTLAAVAWWFTLHDDYAFDLDAVRVPSKYPNKRHYRGAKRGELSCNPLGKNPGDVWLAVTRGDALARLEAALK